MNAIDQFSATRADLVKYTARLLILATVVATLLYGWLAGHLQMLELGAQGATIGILLWVQQKGARDQQVMLAASVLLFIATLNYMNLTLLSGGSSGPVMILAPVLPLLAMLLIGRKTAWTLAGLLIVFVAGVTLYDLRDVAFQLSLETVMTDFVPLTALILAATWVGWHYVSLSESLARGLWEQSRQDHLTGIANRRSIEESLQQEMERARRNRSWLSVLMIDVDHFKQLNDTLGHSAGDRCLKQIAETVAGSLYRPGDRVGRFGGEEFIAVLPETPLEGARHKAEEIRVRIEREIHHLSRGKRVPVTVTMGICCLQVDANHRMETVLSAADTCLYRGKANGRNRVEYTLLDPGVKPRRARVLQHPRNFAQA